jgi:hypothetical protein
VSVLVAVFSIAALAALAVLLRCDARPARPSVPKPVTEADRNASQRLVDLIDILFALVLGLPVLIGAGVFVHPESAGAPVILAFITGYYVVVRSYVDWHIAMEDAPYWIRTSSGTVWELRRIYVDFFIVVAYVVMFLATRGLLRKRDADIGLYLFMLALIPALYLLWGALRQKAYGDWHEYSRRSMLTACLGLLAVWVAYRITRDQHVVLVHHGAVLNVIAEIAALVLVLAYRRANWREMRTPSVATPGAGTG